jgi:hypothetical protein
VVLSYRVLQSSDYAKHCHWTIPFHP